MGEKNGSSALMRIEQFNDNETEQVWELFKNEFRDASRQLDGELGAYWPRTDGRSFRGGEWDCLSSRRDMRIKKLKELQIQNVIKVRYCRTSAMVADIFTKNVNSVTFEKMAEYITGRKGNRVLLLM